MSTSLEFEKHQPVGSTAAVLSDPADLSRPSSTDTFTAALLLYVRASVTVARIRLCEEVMSSVVVDPANAA